MKINDDLQKKTGQFLDAKKVEVYFNIFLTTALGAVLIRLIKILFGELAILIG